MNTYNIRTTKNPNILYTFRDNDVRFHDGIAENVSPELAYKMTRTSGDYIVGNELVPYDPNSWKQEKRIVWNCNVASAQGYGSVAENVIKFLRRAEIDVLNPRLISGDMLAGGEFVDQAVMDSLNRLITPNCIEIQHCQPHQLLYTIVQRIWIYSMFETTHTPQRWIDKMNRAEVVLVPAHWLVDAWKEQGLKRPIEVFGHGVDTDYYHYIDRPIQEKFTFLHYGLLGLRKGTDAVVQAFQDEFSSRDNVELILKHNYPVWPVELNLPRVRYINSTYSKQQMMQLLAESDCLVFPTRGEGFGIPPLEAMATGMPTIVTGWSGPVDYIDPDDTLILQYKMMRAYGFDKLYEGEFEYGENAGEWADPDYDDLRAKMRWAYEHREEAKAMGRRASIRVLRDWNWEKKIQEFIEIINKYA